ncbi:MAG: hypothetical protein ABH851_01770 [Methanobacteriota archaeon]
MEEKIRRLKSEAVLPILKKNLESESSTERHRSLEVIIKLSSGRTTEIASLLDVPEIKDDVKVRIRKKLTDNGKTDN